MTACERERLIEKRKRRREMEIRFIEQKDVKMLCNLLEKLQEERGNLEVLEETVKKLQEKEEYGLFGAFVDGMLVGFVMGICCQDVCGACKRFLVIENVIVEEAYHGQRVAQQLFEALESWSKEKKCYYAILVSGMARERAHHFYQKIGYTKEGGFRKYY